ncbi:MAG: hypothetical protein WAQ42_00325, partial [Limnochordia bacterium]
LHPFPDFLVNDPRDGIFDSHTIGVGFTPGPPSQGFHPSLIPGINSNIALIFQNGMQAIFTDRAPPFSTRSYKAAEEAERKARKDAEKAKAVEIIEKASKQPKIMTQAEYAQWVERYNNIMNEGGEGYVPEMVTVEQLEWARKVLSDS